MSTCGLEDKTVDIKSGDPGSNPTGVNFFFSVFASAATFLSSTIAVSTASIAASTASSFSERFKGLYKLGI